MILKYKRIKRPYLGLHGGLSEYSELENYSITQHL